MSEAIRKKLVTDDNSEISTADLAGRGQSANNEVSREADVDAPLENTQRGVGENRADIYPANSAATSGEVSRNPAVDRNRASNTGVGAAAASAAGTATATERESGPLFSGSEANELRAKWDAIQVGFVDEPRQAVEQADHLVAGTMKRLAEIFAEERGKLEQQWDKGENVSTEDLRQGLRRYRSFFSRLLSV
jgi:hypothetical protein